MAPPPPVATHHVASGRARLAVDVVGEGAPLVLLHAGVADRRSWAGCVPDWVAAGRQVIAYDRRGFGDSTWEAEPHSHVEDLLAVLDALDVERAVLVGNSQGGRIAIDTALAHPGRVGGLVLVGSAVSGEPDGAAEDRPPEVRVVEAAYEAADGGDDLDELNRIEAWVWLDGPLQPEGRVTGAPRERFMAMNGRALAAPPTGEEEEPDPAWDRLHEIGVPTLVVVGEHDWPELVTSSREIATRIPDARLVVLEATAHVPSLDAPAALAAAVTAHLARC